MECMSYAVRIRGLMTGGRESWSNWTELKEVKGMDTEDSKSVMFPVDKVVKEGSNVSFCCIGEKDEIITSLCFRDVCYPASTSQRRMVFTVENVPLSKPGGSVVRCAGSYLLTTLFVTRPPGEPQNLSCETEDMVTLNCSWQPGSKDNLVASRSIKFILSDRSSGKIYCPQESSKSCSFKIGTKTAYDLRLTARNNLGEKQTSLSFDVAHRVHPARPYDLLVSGQNATAVKLQWKMKHKLELLCQVESHHPDGKVDVHNISSHSMKSFHIVSGLQPYAKYTFRVRCGAKQHFWKWSEWSESKRTQTEESAPSGHLDVWRSISPGFNSCNVTVFWKPFPDFRANGEIKIYKIFWETLQGDSGSEEVPASNKSTILFLEKCPCNISVLAKNSVNSSPPSVIVISAAADQTWNIHTSKEDTINNTEAGIYISWQPQSQFDGYIIDWCNHPRVQPCEFQWKKCGHNQSSALITSDAFIPGVQYSFRVYGSLGNRASLVEKKAKYLKEMEPAGITELHVDTVNSRWMKLRWDYDHLNVAHPGFIRGYTVFVKNKDGNCTLKGFEQFAFPDGSVACKYTVEQPAEKTLIVNYTRPNTEYWIQVLAFSTSPPNITYDFIKGTAPQIEKVITPSDGSWVFQLLLLLMVIPVVLLICICFWKSEWVRNCCCPKVPHPYVTPIKVFQMYRKTLLAPSDLSPNNVIIEERKSQPWSHEEKHHHYNQGLHSETPVLETLAFGNISYFTNSSDHYQSVLIQEAEKPKPGQAISSYKPLQHFDLTGNPSSLNYVSPTDLSFPAIKQSQAGTDNPVKPSVYKPQQALESESSTPDASEEPINTLCQAIN
ncbi:oncostatin-M-specific receptor subunit beta-like isoform X2 [Sphaerodactylus townsendi]|nr:oncostatin-M-specific receptor subunit beta-like isoform X2 [Sphaerodactylus townsendi]